FGQKFGERVGVGEHPDMAGEPAGIGAEVLAQPLGLTQDRARMLQQRAAGLGWGHAFSSAYEQRCTQRFFHIANARSGCSQRDMRRWRTARDAPRLDHVAKQAEIGQVEAHGSLRSNLARCTDSPSNSTKESYAKYLLSAKCLSIIFAIDESQDR